MKYLAALSAVLILLVGIAGGRWWYISRDARARDHADAFVVSFRDVGVCEVKHKIEGPPKKMPCIEVGGYLLDELKLTAGATVSIWISKRSNASISDLTGPIKRRNFKILNVSSVEIIEPDYAH